MDGPATLYQAVPEDWLWLPRPLRLSLGYLLVASFVGLFLVVPFTVVGAIVMVTAHTAPSWIPLSAALSTSSLTSQAALYFWTAWLGLLCISRALPPREWEWFRKVGQLWYELLDFSCNVPPEDRRRLLERDFVLGEQFVIGMHPHGVIPFNAILWAAWCDQYLRGEFVACKRFPAAKQGSGDGKPAGGDGKTVVHKLYGVGASADIVMSLPLLRNVMSWLGADGASYHILKRALREGRARAPNRVGRKPRNLYLLPGGIAEIAQSRPGREAIVWKGRRGLCRLSVETGAQLTPCYVFGVNDFYHTASGSASSWLLQTLRKLRIGVAVFWGPLWFVGLPLLPYLPKVTMIIGNPIAVQAENGEPRSVDDIHACYIAEMTRVFDKYKGVAGYPDATLEII